MTRLRYYTSENLENLRSTIADRLDWYYAPEGPLPVVGLGGVRESKLAAPDLAKQLKMDAKRPSKTDVDNALIVYDALSELTSHQASIERMWAYLCHSGLPAVLDDALVATAAGGRRVRGSQGTKPFLCKRRSGADSRQRGITTLVAGEDRARRRPRKSPSILDDTLASAGCEVCVDRAAGSVDEPAGATEDIRSDAGTLVGRRGIVRAGDFPQLDDCVEPPRRGDSPRCSA